MNVPGAPIETFWNGVAKLELRSEAEVEQRLLFPLLAHLGYSDDEVTPKAPVVFQTGRRGRKHEADAIVHHGKVLSADTSLIVVEAKTPEQSLEAARQQAESYAQATRAPFLLISDGTLLEIWQMQASRQSERMLACRVSSLHRHRGQIERLIGRGAAASHCRALGYKRLAEVADDISAYLSAELNRTKDRASIVRRLSVRGSPAGAIDAVDATERGAIILGASGYGKTTLAIDLHRHWLATLDDEGAVPFLVNLPDLAEIDQAPADYIRDRLAAHCPQFATPSSFADLLDVRGARIICDGLDRIGFKAQRQFLTRAANLMRDRPKVQFVILGRTAVQSALDLPIFDLLPLDRNERFALAELVSIRGSMVLHNVPALLTPLTEHPLLLTLLLESHTRTGAMPTRLDDLFETWLARLLEVDGHSPAMVLQLRDLLTRFAVAVAGGSRSRNQVLAEVAVGALEPLDALIATGALIVGERVELQHDALADYLRAEAILDLPHAAIDARLATETFTSGSLFPAIVMAKSRDPALRDAIWQRIGHAGLDIYLDAIRFGGDIDRTTSATGSNVSEAFMREFHDGIVQPIAWYMDAIERELTSALTHTSTDALGVEGLVNEERNWFGYRFFAAQAGDPAIVIAKPQANGWVAGVNLELHPGARNARRLGFESVRDALQTVILRRELHGGPHWRNERLLGRLRMARRRWKWDFPLNIDLPSLRRILEQRRGEEVMIDGFGDRSWTVESMLDDAANLEAGGYVALDAWWEHYDVDPRAEVLDLAQATPLFDEYWRRTQRVVCELVDYSFPKLAGMLHYYQALPVRYEVTHSYLETRSHQSVGYAWFPAATWEQAGADLQPDGPNALINDDTSYPRIMTELARLGRTGCTSIDSVQTSMPRFDGVRRNRGFDGETAVLRNALELLVNDLDRLLGRLPGRGRLKDKCVVGT